MIAISANMSHVYSKFVFLRIAKGDDLWWDASILMLSEAQGFGCWWSLHNRDAHDSRYLFFFYCNLDKVTMERMNGDLTEEFMTLEFNRPMAHKQVWINMTSVAKISKALANLFKGNNFV